MNHLKSLICTAIIKYDEVNININDKIVDYMRYKFGSKATTVVDGQQNKKLVIARRSHGRASINVCEGDFNRPWWWR